MHKKMSDGAKAIEFLLGKKNPAPLGTEPNAQHFLFLDKLFRIDRLAVIPYLKMKVNAEVFLQLIA